MYLYVMKAGNRCKIGKASDPQRRLKELQTGNPFDLELLAAFKCKSQSHAFYLEKLAHKVFARYRINREWFKYRSEIYRFCINLDKQQREEARALDLNARLDKEFFAIMESD